MSQHQHFNIKTQNSKVKIQNLKLKFKTFYFLLVLLPFAFLFLNLAKACAEGLSLGIYPPILQITATPPADITTPISIANLSDQTVNLDIEFKPFTASESENGEISYLSPEQSLSADPLIFQRIQLRDNVNSVNSITLAPFQQKKLNLHIGIPEDEPLSDYYFSVIFISQADNNPNSALQNQSISLGGIAANVLLSIGPKGAAQGNLAEFSAPFILDRGPVPFTIRIKNTGDHVIAPQGQILITNMFRQRVGKVDLLPVNILANTIRAIPDSLQSPDATASSQLTINNLQFAKPKAFWEESFLLGLYKATLTIALSPQGPLFTKTIYFIAFPIQALIGILLVIVIIVLIRKRLKLRL